MSAAQMAGCSVSHAAGTFWSRCLLHAAALHVAGFEAG